MTTIELAHPSTDPVAVPVRWDRRKGAFLLGVPAAWAVLLFLHPTGDGNLVYPVISGQLGRWQAVHVGMAIFIPLFAYVVWTLTAGMENVAARTARVLLPVGAVVYGLFEGMLGIGAGALVGHVQDLPAPDQAVGAALVEDFFMRTPIFRLFEYGGASPWVAASSLPPSPCVTRGPSAAGPSVSSSCRRRSSPRTFHLSARSAWRASSSPSSSAGARSSRRPLGDIAVATASATNVAAPKPHSLPVRCGPSAAWAATTKASSHRLDGHSACRRRVTPAAVPATRTPIGGEANPEHSARVSAPRWPGVASRSGSLGARLRPRRRSTRRP